VWVVVFQKQGAPANVSSGMTEAPASQRRIDPYWVVWLGAQTYSRSRSSKNKKPDCTATTEAS